MPEKYKKIEGWFDWPEFYSYAVEQCEEQDKIVELGSWKGCSFCYLLEAIRESNKRNFCYRH